MGLPETFIGSKVSTLSFLEQKVSKRINSWSNKFLSQGGNEIMIKAVALALPTYSMACFKIPKSLCDEITSLLAKFWWRNQGTGNRSTGSYGTNCVLIRKKAVWASGILKVSTWPFWENNCGGWYRPLLLLWRECSKLDIFLIPPH